MKRDIDLLGVRVHGVPNQFRYREDRLADLSDTSQMVVLDLYLERFRGRTPFRAWRSGMRS
jgi:hypothetical protein